MGSGTYRPVHGSIAGFQAAIAALQKSWREKGREEDVSVDESDLKSHGMSEWSYHKEHLPSVVVWAERWVRVERGQFEVRSRCRG